MGSSWGYGQSDNLPCEGLDLQVLTPSAMTTQRSQQHNGHELQEVRKSRTSLTECVIVQADSSKQIGELKTGQQDSGYPNILSM